MPYMKNFDDLILRHDVIENAIGAADNLTQWTRGTPRISRSYEGKGSENVYVIQNLFAHAMGGFRIVPGYINAGLFKV